VTNLSTSLYHDTSIKGFYEVKFKVTAEIKALPRGGNYDNDLEIDKIDELKPGPIEFTARYLN